jgi:hypothetical protein
MPFLDNGKKCCSHKRRLRRSYIMHKTTHSCMICNAYDLTVDTDSSCFHDLVMVTCLSYVAIFSLLLYLDYHIL